MILIAIRTLGNLAAKETNLTIFIGIAGYSASGKTKASKLIQEYYGDNCVVISFDNYYFGVDTLPAGISFDDPRAIDFKLFAEHLEQLGKGEPIQMPVYDFSTSLRTSQTIKVEPKKIIVIEGILALHDPALRAFYRYSFFIESDEKECFDRRLKRDQMKRGRTEESIRDQWPSVALSHSQFVKPTKEFANKVISNTSDKINFERAVRCELGTLSECRKLMPDSFFYRRFPVKDQESPSNSGS